MQGARLHRQQRDGAAWMAEWLVLPQSVMGLARALAAAEETFAALAPEPAAMARMAGDDLQLMAAEAVAYALAARMPRPEAEAEAKTLVADARASATPLPELARARHPGLELEPSLGQAPAEARAFAAAVGDWRLPAD